jgi:hemoglobin
LRAFRRSKFDFGIYLHALNVVHLPKIVVKKMKHDIETTADIQFLVENFYKKATADAEIGFLFTQIAKTNFEHHLPIMVAFWDFLLLGKDGFRGNMMGAHVDLHRKFALTEAHFNRWLFIWETNLDEHFSGEKAEDAKTRARSIALTTRFKLEGQQTFFQK